MLPLRYPLRWQIAGIVLLLLALAISLLPEIPFWPDNMHSPFKLSDKVLHVVAFALLALWFSGQFSRRSFVGLAAGLLAFGGLVEVLQGMTTYRSAEWLDLTADAGGIAIGLAIALAGAGGWSLRLEQRFADR